MTGKLYDYLFNIILGTELVTGNSVQELAPEHYPYTISVVAFLDCTWYAISASLKNGSECLLQQYLETVWSMFVFHVMQVPVSVGVTAYEAAALFSGRRVIASTGEQGKDFTVLQLMIYCVFGVLAGVVGGMWTIYKHFLVIHYNNQGFIMIFLIKIDL